MERVKIIEGLCQTLNKSYKHWENLRDFVEIIKEFYPGHHIRLLYGKNYKEITININFNFEYTLENFLVCHHEFDDSEFVMLFEKFLFERM